MSRVRNILKKAWRSVKKLVTKVELLISMQQPGKYSQHYQGDYEQAKKYYEESLAFSKEHW
jgi:CRISPR/Cas system-associated endonuclease Cas3-HD